MRDFATLQHHPTLEKMVDIICSKTQNQDRNFFRIEVAYFMGKMAATMRAQITTKDRGNIPVNMYALCLATSGFGKGYSVNIIEESFMGAFRKRFIETTLNELSDKNINRLGTRNAAYRGTPQDQEIAALEKEYKLAGPYPFTFDSGTVPAIKQLRQKLLLADAGAINLQIDEVGSNLLANAEILNTFLELYDKGRTKAKLTKNTADNSRGTELDGPTPANIMLFGTPSKLLDGGSIEDMFFEFLQTGYSRRFMFAWGEHERSAKKQTAAEIYQDLTNQNAGAAVKQLSADFALLADPLNHKFTMDMPDDVAVELIEYKIMCEHEADRLPEHKEMLKTELCHRYFKALKLAGIFTFVDCSPVVTMDHLYYAIHLTEQSGKDFQRLLNREKSYVKLARYIASNDGELTHADLTEALPYYKTSNSARTEIMTLATAWGFKHNIMIRKSFVDGIEFFSGESLEETSLDSVMFSYSQDMASDYAPECQPFDQMYKLTQADGFHWTNHAFENQHRRGDNVIEGFNLVVLDVDGTATRDFVHEVLRDYTFMTYTTKRNGQDGKDRFRVVLPIKYVLHLNKEDYQTFMNNIMAWLPFSIDEEANQRERKWLSHSAGQHHYNLCGSLLDPIRFIPKTSKNEAHKAEMVELKDLDQLERWFAEKMVMGNRNNHMIKFALALYDGGMTYPEIESRVMGFNKKLSNPLPEAEIGATILRTVATRIHEKENPK